MTDADFNAKEAGEAGDWDDISLELSLRRGFATGAPSAATSAGKTWQVACFLRKKFRQTDTACLERQGPKFRRASMCE
jgi:hypothetical protein